MWSSSTSVSHSHGRRVETVIDKGADSPQITQVGFFYRMMLPYFYTQQWRRSFGLHVPLQTVREHLELCNFSDQSL